MARGERRRFGQGDSQLLGLLGIGIIAAALAVFLSDGLDRWDLVALAAAAFCLVLVWSLFFRQALVVDGPILRVRNALSSYDIPLASVEKVEVNVFTNIVAAGQVYRSTALSRSRREVAKRRSFGPDPTRNAEDLAEATIMGLADDARAQRQPGGEVVVRRAWLEIGLLAGFAILAAVLLVAFA